MWEFAFEKYFLKKLRGIKQKKSLVKYILMEDTLLKSILCGLFMNQMIFDIG